MSCGHQPPVNHLEGVRNSRFDCNDNVTTQRHGFQETPRCADTVTDSAPGRADMDIEQEFINKVKQKSWLIVIIVIVLGPLVVLALLADGNLDALAGEALAQLGAFTDTGEFFS